MMNAATHLVASCIKIVEGQDTGEVLVKRRYALLLATTFASVAMPLGAAQQGSTQAQTTTPQQTNAHEKKGSSAGGDVASGTGDLAKAPVKGAADAGRGAVKTAGDLVTLHPINAATDAARGAGSAGKDVAVGTVKGTGKIVRGVGKGIKHIF